MGCGGWPADPPPGAYGTLTGAALTVSVRADALEAGLRGFEDRIGATGLGPLGPAWARARQAVADALADLGGRPGPGGLAADWGLLPEATLQGALSAPEAPALGRALLKRLRGGEDEALPPVVVHARVTAEVVSAERLLQRLEHLTTRLGLDAHRPGQGARPAWLGDAPLAADLVLVGRDEATLAVFALRIRSDFAALDVVLPPRPGPLKDALARLADQQAAPALGEGALVLRMVPAQMAGLEAALDAHLGLRHPDPAVQRAAGDVLATCTTRWAEVAALAVQIEGGLGFTEGRPQLRVEARLTPEGAERWAAAARPLPLAALPSPIGWQVGYAPLGPTEGPAWLDETAACGAGHPLLAALAALPLLPRVLPPELLPAVHPPEGFGLEGADGAAGGVVGVTAGDDGAIPHLVGVMRGRGAPRRPVAEGSAAGGELRWVTPGKVPTLLSFRDLAGAGALVRFSLGAGAQDGLTEPARALGPQRLEAAADPTALARLLRTGGEAGPEVDALAALGARLGRLAASVEHEGERLVLHLAFMPTPAGPE